MANIVLHMGFLNVPYTAETMARPMKAAEKEAARKQRRGFPKTMTAEKVANILEEKYNIMEVFDEIHSDEIRKPMEEEFENYTVELLSERRKFNNQHLVSRMNKKTKEIDKLFRLFLNMEEMNGRVGVPTHAALTGHGRRTRRPGHSFVDTGIYRAAFTSWVDLK